MTEIEILNRIIYFLAQKIEGSLVLIHPISGKMNFSASCIMAVFFVKVHPPSEIYMIGDLRDAHSLRMPSTDQYVIYPKICIEGTS